MATGTVIDSADLTAEGDLNMEQEAGPVSTATDDATATEPTEISDVINDEAVRTAISDYLCAEIKDVRDGNDRKSLEERWKTFRRLRRARVEQPTRTAPWHNAANLMPPLTAQKVNTIYAKLIAAFMAKKPPVQVTALNPDDSDKARSLERMFEGFANSKNGLNMPKNQQNIFYEQASMGTNFVKVPFLTEKWAFKRVGAGGTEQVTYVRHQGPAVQSIRLEDFFTRPYWKDIQRAPWIAIRNKYYRHELLQQGAMGIFNPEVIERILDRNMTEYDDNQLASLTDAKVNVSELGKEDANKEYEIYECYVFWDVDNDGIPEDVKFWVEVESGEILRTEYNPLSIRDIEPFIYQDDPDVLYGVGICEMTESLQAEVTSLHNMRIDGTQLSMLTMFLARRGTGVADEELSPFKVLEMDDPQADMKQLSFQDPSNSCLQGEYVAREYADKVTGASDYMAGFNDSTVKSGATLGGTTYLAQQANTILNSILQNAEASMTNLYTIVFYQCVANADKLDLSFLNAEDQANVREILSMSVEDIPTMFRFAVKATELDKTDEARKQSYLAGSQLYAQYGQQMFQLQQTIVAAQTNAQVAPMLPLAQKLYVGATKFMENMFEFFDVGDPSSYLPYVDDMELELKMQDMAKKQAVQAQKESMRNAETGLGSSATGTQQAVSNTGAVPPADASMGLGGLAGMGATVPNPAGV